MNFNHDIGKLGLKKTNMSKPHFFIDTFPYKNSTNSTFKQNTKDNANCARTLNNTGHSSVTTKQMHKATVANDHALEILRVTI